VIALHLTKNRMEGLRTFVKVHFYSSDGSHFTSHLTTQEGAVVKLQLEKGANLECKGDKYGWTPLL
jgi:hypothetical protein